jgi:energy-coupling factor transporter ATP-binding protein EcfA2
MPLGGESEGILSRALWKLRPTETIGVESVRIVDAKYVSISSGSRQRLMALMRVNLSDDYDDAKLDYGSTIRIALQQQRVKGLFDGLHKARIPFLYVSIMSPAQEEEAEIFEFDLVVGTWVDAKKPKEETVQTLEQRASVLAATLTVALPTATVRRLSRGDLREFVKSLLLPGEQLLPQVGSPSMVSTLGTFEERSPSQGSGQFAPEFYVPNASESGRTGILLGTVKSKGGESHDFRLQVEDLKRHVVILGMTGSGKSTTAASIVKQLAETGLPALVLDWHNEYGQVVASVGGHVLSPGRDNFTINPIESNSVSDPVEHIAMVSDIFSDIYRFTHPQAFMFRNSLQKLLTESQEDEVPRLSSLVRTIESHPLRSAYDNETKVALLRRLVPLTQGQAGRALDGPSTFSIEEFLGKVVCVQLGQIRDTQTRSIFSEILMKMVYEFRVQKKGGLEHLTLVEEARNIAPSRRQEDPPSVGERMISELRKFGEAMLFVAQFPTQIATEVIKNSGVRIIHRVAWPEDVELIGDSLTMTKEQRCHLTRLGVGEAVVSLSRLQKPILVQVRAGSVLSAESRETSFSGES